MQNMESGHTPSMQDIAVRAGVSQTTVSFILSGKAANHRISQSTRDRVLRAAAELGCVYDPDGPQSAGHQIDEVRT